MATSRSLGTLTVDLIAKIDGFTEGMTRAERVADKKSRDIRKNMQARAKEIEAEWSKMSLALAAGISGLGIAVGKVVNNAGEIANLASVANATTTEFQRMAAGANAVGIQQDKLSDQLKDFTEKVGEFQATGGGGMKDFFDQIAPKVGVTAEAFRGLSGPQALQLYYDSLEKAGVSQQQMSFYLESMASDTTALIPLLANGGKAMKELGDAAEATGAVMNENTIEAAQTLKLQMGLLKQQGEGLVNQMVSAMLPTLNNVAGEFANVSVEGSLAADAGESFAVAFKMVASVAMGAYGSVRLLGKALGGLAAMADVSLLEDMTLAERLTPLGAYKGIKNLVTYGSKLKETGQIGQMVLADLDAEAQRLGASINQIWAPDAGAGWAKDLVAQRNAMAEAMRNSGGITISAEPKTGGKSEAEKAAEDARRYIDALKKQADEVQKMTAYEKLLYDLREGSVKFSTEAQRKEAEALAIRADFAKDGVEMERERQRLQQEGARLTEQTLSPLQQLAAEQAKINALYDAGVISLETQLKALDQAEERLVGGDLGKWIRGDVSPLSGGRFDDQEARYEAEKAREEERYAEQLERLTEAMEERGMEQEEFYREYEQLAKEHASRMAQIEQAKEDIMVNKLANGFGQMYDDLSAFATQFGIKNREMLAVIKAAAVAQTVIQTYKAAQDSYAAMAAIPVVGPALGIAAAAAAVAGGLARVNAIRSQGFAEGGYTGAGGKYEVAGVVHKGEGVLSQRDMAALGGVGAFERFRASLHSGYAEGGAVGYPAAAAAGYDLNSTAKTESGASKVTVQLIGGEFQGAAIEEDYDAVNEETIIRVVSRDFQRRGPISQVGSQVFGWNRVGT